VMMKANVGTKIYRTDTPPGPAGPANRFLEIPNHYGPEIVVERLVRTENDAALQASPTSLRSSA
jgi:hypothetical protein